VIWRQLPGLEVRTAEVGGSFVVRFVVFAALQSLARTGLWWMRVLDQSDVSGNLRQRRTLFGGEATECQAVCTAISSVDDIVACCACRSGIGRRYLPYSFWHERDRRSHVSCAQPTQTGDLGPLYCDTLPVHRTRVALHELLSRGTDVLWTLNQSCEYVTEVDDGVHCNL